MKTPAERIRRLGELFDEALDLDPVGREALLERCRAEDPTLADELARLIERDRSLLGSEPRTALGLVETSLDARDSDALQPGSTFGVYTLEQEIGRGGMGRVFRATRSGPDFEQEVAIKFVRRDLLHPALLRRFSTERAILAALDHPGISRLIDASTTPDGTPYVVMEFVRGQAIDGWADARMLGVTDRLGLFRKVLAAVAHAHRNLVVHRDIKASNVLVTDDGEIRLLDFGIAKPLGRLGDVKATQTMDRFLTPSSAAPEQLTGGPITVACDIHALGMLLYELLTGRLPFAFANMTPGEIETAIRQLPPPSMASRIGDADLVLAQARGFGSVRELRDAVRGDLEHIVQRCLRKLPGERYGTVDQLDHDIDCVLKDQPIRERQSDRWYRWRKFVSRHRVASGLALLLFVTIVAAVAAILRQNVAITHERDRAQRAVGLLKNAFTAANPTEVTGANVTARAVLEAARPSLEATFESQPDVYADLASTLAEVELAVGLSPQASELAERAVKAAENADLDPETTGRLLVLEARARTSAGDYSRAEQRLARAAALGVRDTPEWELAMGALDYQRSRSKEAIRHLEVAVGMTRGRPPSDDVANLARLNLAGALRAADRNEEALALLDQTLAWQSTGLATDHPRLTLARLYRLDVLRLVRGAAAAAAEARKVVAEIDRIYSPNSTVSAQARNSLGISLTEIGQREEGVHAIRESLAAWRNSVGSDHPNTLRTAYNLARMLATLGGHDDEVEALYREILQRGEAVKEETRLPLVFWRNHFAQFLLKRERPTEALNLLVGGSGVAQAQVLASKASHRAAYAKVLRQAIDASGCNVAPRAEIATLCTSAVEFLDTEPMHEPATDSDNPA
ncbi:MAG TPA: serine/threonine-protein kinase [Tahibacter sp.]|uniref:serine/threonine-protein kinase n=1 Tax=Tahibacter sp. TaxID=2056211 RepID=UPI002B86C833|nr:serine/threonine-protein kinase [Tahibacter sp.]HSX59695.1 serine/threonine-protein kinase [Tahibacter sp.]